MRDIGKLLLDDSLRSMGTYCRHLPFTFIEENALATGPFKATVIVLPVNAQSGRLWADDFALAECTQLPNGNMPVTIKPSIRWMLNLSIQTLNLWIQ